ncbi:MAG: hypothetical protein K0R31_1265 [Clostridiales bacterium]|nr:hypothetical protein [Clostridiales bacterium]
MAGLSNGTTYVNNGVAISPSVPAAGDIVKIKYDGILSKNGASDLCAIVGFGSKWDNASGIKMEKTDMGFETSVPIADGDTLNICFKDGNDNLDDNSGKNYSFDISQ